MCSCRYYYDAETGWYYLQSRYYDPVIHRFINADSYASTDTTDAIACNMFAYCQNNPVAQSDPTGEIGGLIIGIFIGLGLLLTGCTTEDEEEKNWPSDCRYKYEEAGREDWHNNCYSYAFELGTHRLPGQMSMTNIFREGKISVSDLRSAVLNDINTDDAIKVLPVYANEVDKYVSQRPAGSYLIAAKLTADRSDYHFAVLLENNVWIDKPGQNASRYGKLDGFSDIWDVCGVTYTSEPIYFLYTP